ncbi:hypothetical protein ACHAXA_010936 [Cyclostephanos tholiformis]|uniref:SCP domain-containing protein n=1 Tax=Cyclostephanos tholiformis TaxID=382380 RepID=A0ABD3RBW0_9STRA
MNCPRRSVIDRPRHRGAVAMLTLLALLTATSPSSAQHDDGPADGVQGRRQRRHRGGEGDVEFVGADANTATWRHESVSDHPLTFEAPEGPPPTDRARILAEATASIDDDEYDEIYDEFAESGSGDYYHPATEEDADDGGGYYYPGNEDPSYSFDDGDLEDYTYPDGEAYLGEGQTDDAGGALYFEDSPYDSVDEIVDFEFEEEGWDGADILGEDEAYDDETDGGEEEEIEEIDGEGFNDVAEPKVFEPIARGLRRRFDNPAPGAGSGGNRRRAEAEGGIPLRHLRNSNSSVLDLGGQSRRKLGCSNVKIQFKIDKYGKETTVTLLGNGRSILKSARDVGAYQTKTMQKCVYPGTYTLKLQDNDGICCVNGKGYYKMWVNGQLVVSGGYFLGSKAHTIQIGKNWQAYMTYRDKEWLNAHNSRRRKYNGGMGYVPLRWSRSLASRAKSWANRLSYNCKTGALTHAPGVQEGENLAKNQGTGTWGSMYSADKIMRRWVENELSLPYPSNAHYTQVVWRATQYVGCGEALKSYSNNHKCRVQVCRYVKAGNCAVRNGNWRAEAWDDESSCGPDCPPNEGCFI